MPSQAIQDAVYQKIALAPRDEAATATNRYVRVVGSAMFLCALAGTMLSPWLVFVAFGHRYAAAVPPLRVLLVGAAVMASPILLGPYFLANRRRPGLLSLFAMSSLFLCRGFSLLLIPPMAELGAALALLLAQVVGSTMSIALYLRVAWTRLRDLLLLRKEDFRLALYLLAASYPRVRGTR